MPYKIEPTKAKFLEVYVGDAKRPKKVPLAGSLPAPWILRINKTRALPDEVRGAAWFELLYALFREYVGPQVDQMTGDQLTELSDAWAEANEEEDGASAWE